MRLLDLDLLAFGPFSGTRLDLGRQGVLHVIFGPNEAGKSTALRAITNLFYGIPANTPDAHLHAMPDLRIGARLVTDSGPAVHVVRRKGNKNTLLTPDQTPLPDDAISSLLGGIGEPLFRSMFGLDHVSLRDGAQVLLQGKGTVGESLFAAGFGGRGVHAVLEQLEQEAATIFKIRGQNPKLNEAIRLFKEAEKGTRDAATSADAYLTQQDALHDARTECDSLAEKRRELAGEHNRLQRVLRVLPLMARRNEHSARRLALGEVPPLPDDSGPRRIAAQTTTRECKRDLERLAREIDLLEHRRAELQPPASLLEIDEGTIKDLQDRLGSDRKAEEDLPRRRDELRRLEEEAVAIPKRLGRQVSLDQIESLRVSASQQALIRKLAQERSGLETAMTETKRALEQRSIRQKQHRLQLAALPPAEDVQPLQTALGRAQRLGDIDGTIETVEKETRLEEDLRRRIGSLGLAMSEPASLAALPVPTSESVERFAARFEASDRSADEMGKRRRECHQRSLRVQRELEELRLVGEVPSEEQLDKQRAQRDVTWQQIKRSWQAAEPADTRAEAFEEEIQASDEVADRLRREADRVASRAKLGAELAECEREEATLEQEISGLVAGRATLQAEWTALWKLTGVDPLAPAEMRTWLARFAAAVKVAENLAEKQLALVDLEEKRMRHRAELCAAYRQPGEPPEERIASFDGLLEVARGVLEERLARGTRSAELNRAIDEANAEISELERRHEESSRASEEWKRAWEQSVAPLGLSPGAQAVEALAVLDELTELFGKMESIRQLGRRVEGIVRDATRFSDFVASLAQRHVPNLSGLTATEVGDRLLRSYRQAQTDQRERTAIEAELRAKHAERSECEELATNAASDIDTLCQLAKVESAENLENAEQAAAEIAKIDRELRKIEAELYQAGEGATIDELVELARGVEADSARSRLQEVEAETEEMQERRVRLREQIASWEEGLRHLEAGGRAADAAVEAQEHLAAIKSGVRKYVRLRLAAMLLRREIERYRERAQGPLLARADKLFPRLTLGRYTGLQVGFDTGDDPVLLCLRDDGAEVGVEGLSDGTRDQLYLALRVATLEHHSESNDPMPVILDDVLIHFDDARAAAALEVLAELAGRTQVLFFTHHQHLVDLARATLSESVRVEHQLHLA